MARKPNLIVVLIDDLRFDETSASGHPYMKTPNIDRLAHEGAMFENAFHIAPTLIELAGGKPGDTVQGKSLVPLMKDKTKKWRKLLLCEYWSEGAWPWNVGMGYKAVRTGRYKYIHRTHHQGMAEMYDLEKDPYELKNLASDPAAAKEREAVKKELRKLTAEALGI